MYACEICIQIHISRMSLRNKLFNRTNGGGFVTQRISWIFHNFFRQLTNRRNSHFETLSL